MEKKPNWIELNIQDLHNVKSKWRRFFDKGDGTYKLLLFNKDSSNEQLEMIIGQAEAQAIAIVMEGLIPVRPMIQDVFKSTIDALGYKLNYVVIHSVNDGRYYSSICYTKEAKVSEIDARPADSIAMALRHNSPIYIEKSLFKDYSIST